jgi:hypothetical protein
VIQCALNGVACELALQSLGATIHVFKAETRKLCIGEQAFPVPVSRVLVIVL